MATSSIAQWSVHSAPYSQSFMDCYEERYRERVLRALSQRAAKMGMQIVPIAQTA
jgi:hypothetical protein